METIKKIIIIDIGNSFIKVKHNKDVHYIHSDELAIDNLKKIINSTGIDTAIVSSVDVEMEYKIVDFLASNNISVNLADILLKRQTIIDFSNIQGMGNDRKLGLFGAINFFDSPIITVDCGTTITINIISKDNICLGGAIMCGIGTYSRALEYFTSSLPQIKINVNSFDIIDNTVAAVNAGIISAVRGGIVDFITNAIYKKKLQDVSIIFTGGYCHQVFKLCKNKFNKFNKLYACNQKIKSIEVKNGLVIQGLEKLIELI